MLTVAEMWDVFSASIMPARASLIQRQQMRRCFYAGVLSFYVMRTFSIGDESVEEEAYMNYMVAIDRELNEFFKDVEEGRA